MKRLFVLLAALILYVASPVAQAFATSHVRPPDTALVKPTFADTVAQTTPSPPPKTSPGTLGTFLSENHEAFRTYGLIIGATIGLIFAFWRARIATRQAEAAAARADAAIEQTRAANEQAQAANEQARAANKQAGIAQQGQITERFSRAVEQLGHDRVAVRIGGLYALKRIAEDSVERDHLAVMDVLTSFIRQPPYAKERDAFDKWKKHRTEEHNIAMSIGPPPDTPAKPRLIDCPDIIAAIEIIQGRNKDQMAVEQARGYRLSLTRANLSYLRLPEIDVHNFDLAGANLTGTDLTLAKLLDANLVGANLMSANLWGANLNRAKLTRANFSGTDLTRASLRVANLKFANLKDANLKFANLTDANLEVSILTGANLEVAQHLAQEQLDLACIIEGGKPPILPSGLKPPQIFGNP